MKELNIVLTELGISKVRLAKYLGVSRQMVYNYLDCDDLSKIPNEKYQLLLKLLDVKSIEEIENLDEEEIKIKDAGSVKIEPKIYFDKFSKEMKVEFRIGKNKMYRIKNLSDFYVRMLEKSFYKYGEKLQFIHTKEMFEENSRPLLEFLLKYSEIIKYANSISSLVVIFFSFW